MALPGGGMNGGAPGGGIGGIPMPGGGIPSPGGGMGGGGMEVLALTGGMPDGAEIIQTGRGLSSGINIYIDTKS